VIVAAVAALAAACTGAPVTVVERSIPAPDRAKKLTSKVSQPTELTLRSSDRNEVGKSLLLHWEIRKEGK
jgi:hypothetical protein